MTYSTQTLEATVGSVAWSIYLADDFRSPRLALVFDAAPTSAGLVTVTVDSVNGADYDHIIRSVNPIGMTVVPIEGINGLVNGDKLLVSYANPDGVSGTGSASLEVFPAGSIPGSGLSANDGIVRSDTAIYRRYYHLPVESFDPGASGATFVSASASVLHGFQQNAATEYLWVGTDLHSDWDGVSNPVVELKFTTNVAGIGAADDVDFQIVATYGGVDSATIRTQTLSFSKTIGVCDQYTRFKVEIELDRAAASNALVIGDMISMRLACLATGTVTDVTINDGTFYYNTTHIGIESTDT